MPTGYSVGVQHLFDIRVPPSPSPFQSFSPLSAISDSLTPLAHVTSTMLATVTSAPLSLAQLEALVKALRWLVATILSVSPVLSVTVYSFRCTAITTP